ncbi:MAG: RnfABCDGE type electron transport complex subunit G [Bacteroidaceae bacterium]|nr:RnfABCDGE type electron transport complex subunit G [Bacteroidaceae bacterium]
MKKLESTLPNMAIVLTVISVLAGGILAYVNSVTQGPIEAIKKQTLDDGIKAVLNAEDLKVEEPDTLESRDIIYATDKGTAVQASSNGFGGTLKVLVGFDGEGNITGYQVLEHAETPGLGAKAGEWFQATGKGNIIGKNPGEKELTVSKDGGDVDAITASTITSRAFLVAVNNAYKAFKGGATDGNSGATTQAAPAEEAAPADSVAVETTNE